MALDEESRKACENAIKVNESRQGYDRGFYNHHLPEPLVVAKNKEQFLAVTKTIYEAFCATS